MVRVFWGQERYNVDANARNLLKNAEVQRFDFPKKIETAGIKAAARNPSFFAERTGILVRCGVLAGDDMEKISELLKEFGDDESVAIVFAADSISREKKADKAALAKISEHVTECPKFLEKDRNKLTEFVAMVAGKEGVKIEPLAASEIVTRSDYFGEAEVNLYTLRLITQQVALLGDITVDTVVSVVPESPAEKAYLLSGMLAKGQAERLAVNAKKLLESKTFNEIGLLGLIGKPFRVAYLKRTFGAGAGGADEWKADSLNGLDTAVIERITDVLEEAVLKIKTGGSARVMFDLAIAEAAMLAKG